MKLTAGALTMLLKRYRSVLRKCGLNNILGAGAILACLGGAPALAASPYIVSGSSMYETDPISAGDVFVTDGGNLNSKGNITAEGNLYVDDYSELTATNVTVAGQSSFTADSVITIGNSLNTKSLDVDHSYAYLGNDVGAAGGSLGNVHINKSFLILTEGAWKADFIDADCGTLNVMRSLNANSLLVRSAGVDIGWDKAATGGNLGNVEVRGGSLNFRHGDWRAENVKASGGKITATKNFTNLGAFSVEGTAVKLGTTEEASGSPLGTLAIKSGSFSIQNGNRWVLDGLRMSGGTFDLTGASTILTINEPTSSVPTVSYTGGVISVTENSGMVIDYRALGITVTEGANGTATVALGDASQWNRQVVVNTGGLLQITGFEQTNVSLDSYLDLANALAYVSDGGEFSLKGLIPVDSVPDTPGMDTPTTPDQPGTDTPATPDQPALPGGQLTQAGIIPGIVPFYPDNTLTGVFTVVEGGTFKGVATEADIDYQGAVIGGSPVTRVTTLRGGPAGFVVIGTSDNRPQNASVLAGNTLILGDSTEGNSGEMADLTLIGDSSLAVYGNGSGQWVLGDINPTEEGRANIEVNGATLSAKSIGANCALNKINVCQAVARAEEKLQAKNAAIEHALLEAGSMSIESLDPDAYGRLMTTLGDIELAYMRGASNLQVSSAANINIGNASLNGNAVSGGGEASQSARGWLGLEAAGDILGANITAASIKAGNVAGTSGSMVVAAESDALLEARTVTVGENLTVTNGSVTTTTLTVARTASFNGCALNLSGTGDAASSIGGDLNIVNLRGMDGTVNLGDLSVGGAAGITTAEPVNINAGNLTFGAGNSSITGGANLNVSDTLKMSGSLVLGSSTDANPVNLNASTVDLTGGRLILDPAFGANGEGNTGVALIGRLSGNRINMDVLQNYMASLGAPNSSWLPSVIANAGLSFGRDVSNPSHINAALGLWEPVVIPAGGSLMVDGSHLDLSDRLTLDAQNQNTLEFGKGSLLVVNGDGISYQGARGTGLAGAISAETAVRVTGATDGAKLLLTNIRPGQSYVILGSNIDASALLGGTSWTGANLISDDPITRLLLVDPNLTGGQLHVDAALIPAAEFFPGLDGAITGAVDTAMASGQVHPWQPYAGAKGQQFLSKALAASLDGQGRDAAITIESAARLAAIGAVPQMARQANLAAGAAVTERLSLGASAVQPMEQKATDAFSLWVMPLYQSVNGFGMEAGNFDYDFSGGLGGATIGADYSFNDSLRAGILLNIGGGYARGSGGLNDTDNDMSFWGIGAYGGWSLGNLALLADINFTSTYNELKQDLPDWMGWNELKSDVTARALSVGLRAEYLVQTEYLDILPHVGARYMNIHLDNYKVKNGATVFKGDDTYQNIWSFPVGVSFSKEVAMENGWHVKPMLDLEVIPSSGDIDVSSKGRFTGTGTKLELDTKTMDYFTWGGNAALEFSRENISLSVRYSGQFGQESSSHGLYGVLRYEF